MPTELVVAFDREERDFYTGCYELETDFEGNEVWPEPYQKDGQWFGMPPRQILQSDALKLFLVDVRAEPDCFDHVGA